jgi:hypothetical protein
VVSRAAVNPMEEIVMGAKVFNQILMKNKTLPFYGRVL